MERHNGKDFAKRHERSNELHEEARKHLSRLLRASSAYYPQTREDVEKEYKRTMRDLAAHEAETVRDIRKTRYKDARDATELDKKLLAAVTNDNPALVRGYLEEGASADALFHDRHAASPIPVPMIFPALEKSNEQYKRLSLETMELLVVSGKMNANVVNSDIIPFLNVLILYGYGLEFIRLAVEKGDANPDLSGHYHLTPLMEACITFDTIIPNFSIIDYLASKSKDIDAVDLFNLSALDHATDQNFLPVMRRLAKLGARFDDEDKFLGRLETDFSFLDERTADLYLLLSRRAARLRKQNQRTARHCASP